MRSSNCTTSTNYLPGARCWIMNSEFLLWSGTYLLPTYFSIRYNLAPYSIYQIVYIITIIVSTRIQELYAIPTLLDIKKKNLNPAINGDIIQLLPVSNEGSLNQLKYHKKKNLLVTRTEITFCYVNDAMACRSITIDFNRFSLVEPQSRSTALIK